MGISEFIEMFCFKICNYQLSLDSEECEKRCIVCPLRLYMRAEFVAENEEA